MWICPISPELDTLTAAARQRSLAAAQNDLPQCVDTLCIRIAQITSDLAGVRSWWGRVSHGEEIKRWLNNLVSTRLRWVRSLRARLDGLASEVVEVFVWAFGVEPKRPFGGGELDVVDV